MNVKISLVTVSFNAVNSLQRCIDSVVSQDYPNMEYIVIDGNSVDGTKQLIARNAMHIHAFCSEPDRGIYDAINKGIAMATGDVIGVLHADDYFANGKVMSDIAFCFETTKSDVLYADLDYIDAHGATVRRWRSGSYRRKKIDWGWMPPHPTFYARKELFDKWGVYHTGYGTAADYELMLRFLFANKAQTCYLNKVIVKMAVGGVSNRSLGNRFRAWNNDFRAMKDHKLRNPFLSMAFKPLRKITQFV